MRQRFLALPAVGLALSLAGAAPAQAHDHGAAARGPAVATSSGSSATHLFAARLSGANEVPAADPDGSGNALVVVRGNRVTFALQWSNITAPILGHIHRAAAGVNGPVVVPFFGTPMPATATAAAGAVTVSDPQIAADIVADPAGFYVNLHTAAFPGGAIRGQLGRLRHAPDLRNLLPRGRLHAILTGAQEVPAADPDGRAIASVNLRQDSVDFRLAWTAVSPILGHIHRGAAGTNGPVVVPFFTTAVPASIFALAGTVPDVDPALVREIRAAPGNYYVNLHTVEFPTGAVRGQLH
jgi:hypothetical protein